MQVVLGIDGGHRSGFGTAVSFVDFLAELEAECGREFRTQCFGTSDNQADILERHRVHVAANRKRTQEGRGRDESRNAEFRTYAGHGLHVGRVGNRHDGATFGKVQERSHREAEAMEQREFRKHHVVARHVENTSELLDIAHQVPVAQHHALRGTFRARTEHDGGNTVEAHALAEQELDEPCGRNHAEEHVERDLRLRDFLHQVFGVKQVQVLARYLRIVVSAALELFNKHAARDDRLHVGTGGTELHVVDRRGVVQVHVGLATEPEREVHNHARRRRREHNAHVLFFGPDLFPQELAERDNRAHELVAREVPAVRIVDGRAVLHVLLVRLDPGVADRLHERDGVVPGVDGNLADDGTNLVRGRRRVDGRAESDGHGTFGARAVHV